MAITEPKTDAAQALMAKVGQYLPAEDVERIERAYEQARDAHAGQSRETGASFIDHPVAVAAILADLQMDAATLQAALLHDVVEDTGIDLPEIESRFGPEVARLVDGLTKLSAAEFAEGAPGAQVPAPGKEGPPPPGSGGADWEPTRGATFALAGPRPADSRELGARERSERTAANIRKIFLAMARDVRVMIIKLADRLHNMRTLGPLPPERRVRIATETLQIFAPLAHRLGIWQFKWALEDLAFKELYPEEYAEIADQVSRTRTERESEIAEVIGILQERLQTAGLEAEIQGRPKHLWSIYQKIQKQELTFDEIYDLVAVRIIVNTIADCYHALGIVHDLWLPITGMFSDHIARPKSNMYQSLHTKVIGPRGEPLEIQIRTWDMHRTADFGIAAHWQYKEGGRPDRRFEEKLAWLRQQLFDWQSDARDATEFLRSVIDDMFTDQVFVFTPRGDVIDLPAGSGPIDFAFRIHSDVGLHLAGAKVNGRLVPLSYCFKNGDIVEIMTRPSAHPSLDWLKWVKTSHARQRIKGWFRKQRHAENVVLGREILEREANRLGMEWREISRPEMLAKAAQILNYSSDEDMLAAIGFGNLTASTVLGKIRTQEHEAPQRELVTGELVAGKPTAETQLSISAGGVDDVFIRRSRCCQPLPGDEVIGYVTRGKGMAIHRLSCPNVHPLVTAEPDRIVAVAWKHEGSEKLPVRLRIDTLDRVGLLTEISSIFSERKTNIQSANVKVLQNKTAVFDLVVEVSDLEDLEQLIRVVEAIPDVLAAERAKGQQ
jgi:guanosine-3',5'-bis(diphosphate) 3'-pyrophosphohydrolase